jgi:hypothetical protein
LLHFTALLILTIDFFGPGTAPLTKIALLAASTATTNNQAYTGAKEAIDRSAKRKVIVQRAVTEVPQAASVSVDNSSIAGGENGNTNNWL